MNTKYLQVWFGLLVLPLAVAGQSLVPVNRFLTLLELRDYGTLHSEAQAVRNKPGGKNYLVDYFVARALCGSPETKEKGGEWFDHLLDSYAIPVKLRATFVEHRLACGATDPGGPGGTSLAAFRLELDPATLRMEIDPATVHGKLGPLGDCFHSIRDRRRNGPGLSEQLNALESKLMPVQMADSAAGMSRLREVLGREYAIAVRDRFIIVTPKGKINWTGTDQMEAELKRTTDHLLKQYGLRGPAYYIIVGAMPGGKALGALALKVHGLALPKEYYGYSSIGDMAVFANAAPQHMATVRHELFHLLVRSDIGDIPPWLDEGIASLYEASYWRGDTLFGSVQFPFNYRLDALRNAQYLDNIRMSIPRLDQLVAMNWERFEGMPDDLECVLALHYAISKHVALYLQERGMLVAVVDQYRHAFNGEAEGAPLFRTGREMMEAALGEPLEATQEKFEAWFKETYGFDVYGPR